MVFIDHGIVYVSFILNWKDTTIVYCKYTYSLPHHGENCPNDYLRFDPHQNDTSTTVEVFCNRPMFFLEQVNASFSFTVTDVSDLGPFSLLL